MEQFSQIFLRNTSSWVLHYYFKWYVKVLQFISVWLLYFLSLLNYLLFFFFLFFYLTNILYIWARNFLVKILTLNRLNSDRNISLIRCNFNCIWKKIQKYLSVPSLITINIFNEWQNLIVYMKTYINFLFVYKKS